MDERTALDDYLDDAAPSTRIVARIAGHRYLLKPGDILGRAGTVAADRFAGDKTVSRRHARIDADGEKVWLHNLTPAGNPISVDGRSAGAKESVELSAGRHTVRLGLNYSFEVEIHR